MGAGKKGGSLVREVGWLVNGGTSDMPLFPQCFSMISTLFAVCALVIFFQETEVQLDYFSVNFIPMGHGVRAGEKTAAVAAAEQRSCLPLCPRPALPGTTLCPLVWS